MKSVERDAKYSFVDLARRESIDANIGEPAALFGIDATCTCGDGQHRMRSRYKVCLMANIWWRSGSGTDAPSLVKTISHLLSRQAVRK